MKDYEAELAEDERRFSAFLAEDERRFRQYDRRLASIRFWKLNRRPPSDEEELSRFIVREQELEARSQQEQAAREERINALYQSMAEKYDQWLKSIFLKLMKVLEHQKPDRTAALRKLTSNKPHLKPLVAAGGFSLGLPVSKPALTGQAKAVLGALCREFEGDYIGELQEALDWRAEGFPFAFPYAEYIDKGGPCLAFTALVYGIIAFEISKKPSFDKLIGLYRVKKGEKKDEGSFSFPFSFNYPPPYFLGYHWHIVDLGRSSESLIVPIVLLDGLSKGQIEVEGLKVKARQGDCTIYGVQKGSDETIAISDGFTGFLHRLKPPWYQDLARLGVIDTRTSEIVQLKLAQATSSSTASQQSWSDDDFIDCLTSPALGLSAVVAKEKLKILKGKNIDRNISLEDAVKLALRE